MKRIALAIILSISTLIVKAADFSAVCPSGQTMYYRILDEPNQVAVVHPSDKFGEFWTGFVRPKGNLVLPDSVVYKGKVYIVSKIEMLAFEHCKEINELTLPNTVTEIETGSFKFCTKLKHLYIPASAVEVDGRAFEACSSLESIVVDSLNPVYDSRDNCNALIKTDKNALLLGCRNTIIPNSVTSIQDFAFAHCGGLTDLVIPNSVTAIGECAFVYCPDLTSIQLPEHLEKISNQIFNGCENLTTVTIPEGVRTIGAFSFAGCSKLTELTLPRSLKEIGYKAFEQSDNLSVLVLQSPKPPLTKSVLGVNSNCKFIVPCGQKAMYETSLKGKIDNTIEIEEHCEE